MLMYLLYFNVLFFLFRLQEELQQLYSATDRLVNKQTNQITVKQLLQRDRLIELSKF